MSIKHDLQMLITVVLLATAAGCLLFQKDVPLTHVVEWPPIASMDASMPVLVMKDVDTRTKELVEYDGDIKGLELTNLSVSVDGISGNKTGRFRGEIAFAEVGSTEFIVLGDWSEAGETENMNPGKESAVIIPDTYASKKLSELISRGSKVTFRLKTMADYYPPDASVCLIIASKMMVEI